MTNYRETLRLSSQGISQRSIAVSCEYSRNIVSSILKRAKERGISWTLPQGISDSDLIKLLFPTRVLTQKMKYYLHLSGHYSLIPPLSMISRHALTLW